jgi:uncharacterized phage infection (PIP) family protein YhgE
MAAAGWTLIEWSAILQAGAGVATVIVSAVGLVLVVKQLTRMNRANEIAAEAAKSAAESAKLSAAMNEIAAEAAKSAAESAKLNAAMNEIAAEAGKTAAEAAKLSAAMAVVTLEQAIVAARRELSAVANHIQEQAPMITTADELRLANELELYLNQLDRLCSYIRRGHIDEKIYREDYRLTLVETVRDYRSNFGPDTRHHNIVKVHDAWRDNKSARDLS